MKENDNILLAQFFEEAARQQVADDGFSERVMAALPAEGRSARVVWLSHLWTLFCVAVAVLLFVLLQGWTALASYAVVLLTYAEVFVRTLPTPADFFDGSMVNVAQLLVSLVTLSALSVIGLTRWVLRRAW